MIRNAALALTFAAAFCVGTASASPLVTVLQTTSIAYSGYEAVNAIDTGGNKYLTDFAGNGTGVGTHIDFGFSAPVSFSKIVYTDRTSSGGANGSNSRGLSDFVSQYKYDFASDAAFTTLVSTFISPLLIAPSGSTSYLDFQHSNSFNNINAQFVRFTVLNTTGRNPGAADFAFTTNDVPEPTTIALLGLGLLGVAASRRKSAK